MLADEGEGLVAGQVVIAVNAVAVPVGQLTLQNVLYFVADTKVLHAYAWTINRKPGANVIKPKLHLFIIS